MPMPTRQWIEVRNIVPALCGALLFGATLFAFFAPSPETPELDQFLDRRVSVEGIVVRDPDIRDTTIRLTVEVSSIGTVAIDRYSRIIVSVDRFQNVSYGDRIKVTGTLKKPEPFETDSGRTFNYPKYLLAHGITHQMSFVDIEVVASGEGNSIVARLLSIKHAFLRGIKTLLPEPESALLAGLLLGEKQSLGEKITEAFRNAGVVHIIVLSGYNVALVISAVTFVALRILPRVWAYVLAGIFVVGFAVMTGASETTIRATVMALLMMVATVLNRPSVALRGLLIASTVMAISSPLIVLYDLSFQLSVLATLGLIIFSERISKRITFVPEKWGIRDIVATTLATQITVLPLLVLSIGQVSSVFLPANILILGIIPFAMLVGFIGSIVALIFAPLSIPFGFVVYWILHYIIAAAVWFGTLPFASIKIPPDLMWVVLASVLGLYCAVFIFTLRKKSLLNY